MTEWRGKVLIYAFTDVLQNEMVVEAVSKKQYYFLAHRLREQKEKEGFQVMICQPSLSRDQGRLF